MEIHFTIGWAWIEFLCHFIAAFLYMAAGYEMTKNGGDGFFLIVIAIVLNVVGANL